MEQDKILQIINQAKSDLNASKGRADGVLHDAIAVFINACGRIIDQQITEIAGYTGEIKKLREENEKLKPKEKEK